MLKKDNQNTQLKIKGPLIFEESKWNNIPECIISFFNILNAKVVEIETNHSTFKSRAEQNFTKQNQVINECKTLSEETEMKFNLSNQSITANMNDIKNKCDNSNSMMRIKLEEEIEKLNKRIDDISRGVNLKIEDNTSTLSIIKKDVDQTKQIFQEALDTQKNDQRIIDVILSSTQIKELIKENSAIEHSLNDLKQQIQLEAKQTFTHILGDYESEEDSKQDGQGKDGLLKKIDQKLKKSLEQELNRFKEQFEKNILLNNEKISQAQKDVVIIKDTLKKIENTNKEKDKKVIDITKLSQRCGMLETQIKNANNNFGKIQEDISLISNTLSHKLIDKMKLVTTNQMNKQPVKQSEIKIQQTMGLSESKIEQSIEDKSLQLNSTTISNIDQKEENQTMEDQILQLQNRITLLESQCQELKLTQAELVNNRYDENEKKSLNESSKTNPFNKPWLSGQEVILKEGDNLAIKVFQKSQQINKKSSKYSQMYANPQIIANKYRNSVLGQDIEQIKANNNAMEAQRSNSYSKIKEIIPNPHNMTAYYKQNYAYSDSSPEKSKKNSISGLNSSKDLQFTNDLIKSQLDNYTSKPKQQQEPTKNEMNWIEGVNQNVINYSSVNYNRASTSDDTKNNSNIQRKRNSKSLHQTANSALANKTTQNLLTPIQDQHSLSFVQVNNQLDTQTQTNANQNINNLQSSVKVQQDSPINTYKIAKNVMKNTKIKSFRISQGVSFDAINLSKF